MEAAGRCSWLHPRLRPTSSPLACNTRKRSGSTSALNAARASAFYPALRVSVWQQRYPQGLPSINCVPATSYSFSQRDALARSVAMVYCSSTSVDCCVCTSYPWPTSSYKRVVLPTPRGPSTQT